MGRASVSRIPVVELVVTEELDLWALSRLTRLLDDALAVSPVEIVLDLAQCPYLDAAAIGVLLEAHRRARLDGGLLTLRSPSDRLRRNLRLARADRVLHVVPPDVLPDVLPDVPPDVPDEMRAETAAEKPAEIRADGEV